MKVQIDLDRISQRILALPDSSAQLPRFDAGKEGNCFCSKGPGRGARRATVFTVQKFDLKTRKMQTRSWMA